MLCHETFAGGTGGRAFALVVNWGTASSLVRPRRTGMFPLMASIHLLLRLFALAGLGCLAVAADPAAPVQRLPKPVELANLGPQLTARTLQSVAFTRDSDGAPVACVVVRSQPAAKLAVVEVQTGVLRRTFDLPGANGSWGSVRASDGSVYIGTEDSGKLFRWVPGESGVRDLGTAIPGETFIWNLAAGADGEIFGATYKTCRVFRYSPADGFSEPSPGPIVAGETYARSVAYDAATRSLFVGVGVKSAHLIEIDLKTGAKREWLPEQYRSEQSVYGLALSGNHVVAMLNPSHRTLVFARNTRAVIGEIEVTSLYEPASQPSPYDGRIYYVQNRRLRAFDPRQPREASPVLLSVSSSQAMQWLPAPGRPDEPWLVIFTQQGQIVRYHPPSGRSVVVDVAVPEQPTIIQSLSTGPDGRIWMGGYLSGGTAAYDPTTGRTEQFKGLSQAEGMASLGETLFFGLYPGGRIAEYDTTRPWNMERGNPQRIATVQDQSRPFALVGVPELNRLFVGMVPEYGLLGGTLSVWDAKSRKLETFAGVVPQQALVSLTYAGGFLVGGTTIRGGLGVEPKTTEGRLILWDPVANRKVFETVPVPGRGIVSGLTPMRDGTVWGFAQGAFFIFDLKSRQVVHVNAAFSPDFSERAMWQDANLVVHPSGMVYAVEDGNLLRIDPRTREITVLRTGVEKKHARPIAIDRAGRIYVAEGINLLRYEP